MTGGSPSVPQPSAEEKALQREQAETLRLQRAILEQQIAQQKVLVPFLAAREGFEVQTDANGNVTSIREVPDELKALKTDLEKKLAQRSLTALEGKLPVDPALEETLTTQEKELRSRLSSQLGPGYETSSPGVEALGNFFRSAEMLREGARTDQLTLAEQLGIVREQQRLFSQQSQTEALTSATQGVPLTLAGAFGQNARGFGGAQEPFIQNRQMQFQGALQGAANQTKLLGAGIGLVGTLFSDAALKELGADLGKTREGVPIRLFRFKGSSTIRVGAVAQDVAALRPELVTGQPGSMRVFYGGLDANAS
jgi:hypothetical protein